MDDDMLVTRVIETLADRCGWAWRPAGPAYTAAETGLHYGPIGTTPDRAVGVTLYATDDDLLLDGSRYSAAVRRVQIRFRGAKNDPTSADQLASAAFRALQGLSRVAGLNHAQRILTAPLGVDGNARTERADSYIVIPDTEA